MRIKLGDTWLLIDINLNITNIQKRWLTQEYLLMSEEHINEVDGLHLALRINGD